MSSVIVNEVRAGFYIDSVALMRLSRTIAGLDGVEEAALMMGTPANLEILDAARLLADAGRDAKGGDLVIGVRAGSAQAANDALGVAVEELGRSGSGASAGAGVTWRPKSLRAAVNVMPDANLALISVPGDFAAAEARKAVRRGLHAMIFSDNVNLEDEVALKQEAQEHGCLVMGPDCGTAILNGVPLAFANQVRPGNVGLIGASGTGIQEVTCLIDRAGGGVSQAIGVGGRDVSEAIGGLSTLTAIEMLERDAATEKLVVISKPPPARVAETVLERIAGCGMPTTVCFVGADAMTMPANAVQVMTLQEAARQAVGEGHATVPVVSPASVEAASGRRVVRGLFAGGTLCAEAQVVFRSAAEDFCSNAPLPGARAYDEAGGGHVLLDLGADEYTRGRPHPMIDPTVRDESVMEALASQETAVVLLDVVIGYGAHHDPAGHLASVLAKGVRSDGPAIIASVTGTDADMQNRSVQVAKLEAAGVHVAPTNADAAAWAIAAVRRDG